MMVQTSRKSSNEFLSKMAVLFTIFYFEEFYSTDIDPVYLLNKSSVSVRFTKSPIKGDFLGRKALQNLLNVERELLEECVVNSLFKTNLLNE